MSSSDNIHQLTAHLFRENSGKMLAVLSRLFSLNQIDALMDIVQDTFESALTRWRYSGVPENPSAWLMQVAKNKAVNHFKREGKSQSLSDQPENFDSEYEQQKDIFLSPKEIQDSQLRLLFLCCHSGLSAKNQIIITLHILCGFGVPEIANALVMKEEGIKKALTRSKALLKGLDSLLNAPGNPEKEQLHTVQTILYLMFNEGYKTTRSKLAIDHGLCYEAIRLTKLLVEDKYETNGETNALLALMFFTLSRFPARLSLEAEWLTLEEQDRGKWNRVFIEEGYHYLNVSRKSGELSRYHIEALISSLHCTAQTFEQTDWKTISSLYRQLELMDQPSPYVQLNRIIAESYLSIANSLNELLDLETSAAFKNSFLVSAAKGDLYRRNKEWVSARFAYEKAMELASSPSDKKLLKRKLAACVHQQN